MAAPPFPHRHPRPRQPHVSPVKVASISLVFAAGVLWGRFLSVFIFMLQSRDPKHNKPFSQPQEDTDKIKKKAVEDRDTKLLKHRHGP